VRALGGIVLALAFGSQASAATVARTNAEAGPVLAGPEVLWGSQRADGSVRVMAGAPGWPPRLVHRVAAPTGAETSRAIGPVTASTDAFAVRVGTSDDFRSELVLRPLTGGPRRTLARLGEGRDLTGALDSDATRATWAVKRAARRSDRIVLRAL
jgi:hypothetical protein